MLFGLKQRKVWQLRGLGLFEGEGGAGGSGGGTPPAKPDPAAELEQLRKENAELKKKAGAPAPDPKPDPAPDPELRDKARLERERADKESARSKALESSIRFNLKSAEFLKTNASLLPQDAEDIFRQAEKENYSDAIEKDQAIKSGLVQSFFAVQTNVDLLTSGQKATLDDYLKLTKTEKQARAQSVYDMVFEPAFETLKRVKRAEALSKGYGGGSDSETAYKDRMMKLSKKHYLGEKSDA